MSSESEPLLPKEKELTNDEKLKGYELYSLAKKKEKEKFAEFQVLFNAVKDNPKILNYAGVAGEGRWAEDTPLWAAVEVGNTEALRLLANAKGIEIDKLPKNHYGNRGTPLYRAVLKGDVESVEILLNAGANINYEYRDNTTPITIAIEKALTEKEKAYQKITGLLTAAAASKNGGKRKRKKSIRKRKNMKRKFSRKR